MAEKKPESYGIGAFASVVHTQQKYIVFNRGVAPDTGPGAERFSLYMTSHELLHALGFDHPRSDAASGEKPNTRDWEQIQRDIASNLNSATALGRSDGKGGRIITYSFAADPRLTVHGYAERQQAYAQDANYISVNNMTNLQNADEKHAAIHQRFREAVMEAFAAHGEVIGITYEEAKNPAEANLLLYAGDIPPRPTANFELTRGSKNAYTHDVTILSYNQAPGVWLSSGVGEVYIAQKVYGKPQADANRHLVTDARLVARSGVLWDHEPLAIRLTQSPMLGALNVDMGAHPFQPAITGVLRDGKAEKKVRQHIGANASLREVDASGSKIELDITGADGAVIKLGGPSTVRLKGRANQVTLGPGADSVQHEKGYGHRIAAAGEGDTISAKAHKAWLQQWNGADSGTHVTLLKDDNTPAGSLFVQNATPQEVAARLKGIAVQEAQKPKPLALDALDGDEGLKTAPAIAWYAQAKDVAVSASAAAGHFVGNNGGGQMVIKMTRPQYDSRSITWKTDGGGYYALTFRDGGEEKKIHVPINTRIAVLGPDGEVEKLTTTHESLKELELAAALRKGQGVQLAAAGNAALPRLAGKLQIS
ncbi:MAG: hypothetical protein EBV03_10580 [Proteobacteria bacterium]|nr:hypothetical protein [Pseudomonadota bacterium]